MIDKSIKADYAIQGGGPNYLGKQKMVTAPKKWLSSPDHEPAELAYITEKEKDILIDLDLYGSLNGKPNRGPAGIMSLQGDLGGYSGGRSSSNDRDGGDRNRFRTQPAPTPTVTRSRIQEETQKQFEADQAARVKDILTRGGVEDRISRGAVDEITSTGEYNAKAIQEAAKKQARERILGIGDPLTTEEITSLPLGVNISDFVPEQEKTDTRTLTQKLMQPTFTKKGVKKTATDFAKKQAINFAAQKAGLSGALSFANPLMALYGFLGGGKKDPLRSIRKQMAKFTPNLTTGTRKTTPLVASGGDGQRVKTVAERVATGQGLESGAKLLGVQNTQKAELFKRRSMVEDILRKGSYQGRDLTSGQRDNLMNYIEQINKFLVPVQQGI